MHKLSEVLAAHFSDCAVIVKEKVSVNSQKMLPPPFKNKQKTKLWRLFLKRKNRHYYCRQIKQELFCHLIVYVLLNYFGVLWMGRSLSIGKAVKLQSKAQNTFLLSHFPKLYSEPNWRLCKADSGSWAFCLRSLLHCIFEQYNPFMWCNMQCACRQTCLSSAHPSHGTFSSCMW